MNRDEAVSRQLPVIYLARHGESAWTLTGQHTRLTDLLLTETGERNAVRLGNRLRGITLAKVFTSPRSAQFGLVNSPGSQQSRKTDCDLVEWNYGEYEGRTGAEIRAARPEWNLFRDGCPEGESPQQAACRADRVVHRMRAVEGDVLLFTSGHFIRVLASRWIGIEPTINDRSFMLSTASLSVLGYEQDLSRPVIRLWNETHHVHPLSVKKSLFCLTGIFKR